MKTIFYMLLLFLLPTTAGASCFENAQSGRIECKAKGSIWRGAEQINDEFSAPVATGIDQARPNYSISFSVRLVNPEVIVVRMVVAEGYNVQAREIPIHRGVLYGNACKYRMNSGDEDNDLKFTCRIHNKSNY